MSGDSLGNFLNEQNRQKFEIYCRDFLASRIGPSYKEYINELIEEAGRFEEELRKIVKSRKIKVAEEDLNSLLHIMLDRGVRIVMTLEGTYLDNKAGVFFLPITKTSMEGKEKGKPVLLSFAEAEGFRKKFPFDELKEAYDEARLEVEHKALDEQLDPKLKKKK